MANTPSIYNLGSGYTQYRGSRGLDPVRAVNTTQRATPSVAIQPAAPSAPATPSARPGRREFTQDAYGNIMGAYAAQNNGSPIGTAVAAGNPGNISVDQIVGDTTAPAGSSLLPPDPNKIATLRTPSDAWLSLYKKNENGEVYKDENGRPVLDVAYIQTLPPNTVREIFAYERDRTTQLRAYLQPYQDAGVFADNADFQSLYNSTDPSKYDRLTQGYDSSLGMATAKTGVPAQQAYEADAGGELLSYVDLFTGGPGGHMGASGALRLGLSGEAPTGMASLGRAATFDSAAHDEQRGEEIGQAITFNDKGGALGEGLRAPIEAQYRGTAGISQGIIQELEPNLRKHGALLGLGDESAEAKRWRFYNENQDRYSDYMQTPEGQADPSREGFTTWMLSRNSPSVAAQIANERTEYEGPNAGMPYVPTQEEITARAAPDSAILDLMFNGEGNYIGPSPTGSGWSPGSDVQDEEQNYNLELADLGIDLKDAGYVNDESGIVRGQVR